MIHEPATDQTRQTPTPAGSLRHGGHGLMMLICCIPMVAITVALVAVGAVNSSFLVAAGLCVAMMALMMRSMDHSGGSHV